MTTLLPMKGVLIAELEQSSEFLRVLASISLEGDLL